MKRAEAVEILSRAGWLTRHPEAFRAAFLAEAELRVVPAGTALMNLDTTPRMMFGLASGLAESLVAPGPFMPILVDFGGPGWWAGSAALVSDTPVRIDVTARMDSHVLAVPEGAIKRLAARDPETWRRVGDHAVWVLDNAIAATVGLAQSDLRLRMIATLWRLAREAHPGEVLEIAISQTHLAELTSLSRNKVGSLLAELAGEGLVETRYGRVLIHADRLNAAMLHHI